MTPISEGTNMFYVGIKLYIIGTTRWLICYSLKFQHGTEAATLTYSLLH